MIRDVNGQHVTTWGRDLDGDLWVGDSKSITTVTTCPCGKTHTYRGFPGFTELDKAGWVPSPSMKSDGWYCSLGCLTKYEREACDAYVAYLEHQLREFREYVL